MSFTTSAFGRGILGVLVAPSAALSSTNTVAFAVVGDFCEMMLPPAATVVFESPFQPPSPCLESHHLPRPCANNLFPPLGAASVPRSCRQSLQSPVFFFSTPHPQHHPDLLPRDSAALLHSPRPPSITAPPPSPWQSLFTPCLELCPNLGLVSDAAFLTKTTRFIP